MGNCLGRGGGINDGSQAGDLQRGTLARSTVAEMDNRLQSMEVQRNYQSVALQSRSPVLSTFTDVPINHSKQTPSVTSTFTEALTQFIPYNNPNISQSPSLQRSLQAQDLRYEIPEGTPVVTDAIKVDIVGSFKGLEMWRGDSDDYGLVLLKICHPSLGSDNNSIAGNERRRMKHGDEGLAADKYFENELRMLQYLQKASKANQPKSVASYRSQSPLKAGYDGIAFDGQHDNVIGFVGYMEAKIDLSNAEIVDRRIVTEYYVDTLRQHVRHRTQGNKKEMKHFEAALYAFQTAKGLLSLHRLGVAHRDLTTENIVMGLGVLDKEYKEWLKYVAREETRRALETYAHLAASHSNHSESDSRKMPMRKPGQQIHYYKYLQTQPLVAKLANLGNAAYVKENRTTTRVGPANFQAPEMMRGQEYGVQCDVWSFGCVMYEMITGVAPFYKKAQQHIEQRVLGGKFPKSEQIGGSSFSDLVVIMRNCLKTEPQLRCSAKDLVEDLGKL